MRWLDRIPLWLLVLASLTLGMAPFFPEPHLVEKLRMLAAGELRLPMDVFDLMLHGAAPGLLLAKTLRMLALRGAGTAPPSTGDEGGSD